LNRDAEDEHGCSTSNDDVSSSNGLFHFDPELWKFGNWTSKQLKIPFNFAPLD
jgi:hypothetical protein